MKYLLSLLLILSLASTVFATDYRGECTIVFNGDSTLHGFQGKAKCEPFSVSKSDGILDVSKISVAVAGMDTDNKKRDKQMREMFEEKKYPMITGSAGSFSLNEIRAAQKGSDGAAKVSFKLKIRDIEKPVTATLTKLVESDSRISADLSFALSLAGYQLKPPSVLGVIRVDDKISVTATVVLSAK